jgi:hypothetical protein
MCNEIDFKVIFLVVLFVINDVLRTNGHTVVNKDDDIDKKQFNKEDYCGYAMMMMMMMMKTMLINL